MVQSVLLFIFIIVLHSAMPVVVQTAVHIEVNIRSACCDAFCKACRKEQWSAHAFGTTHASTGFP